MVDTSNDTSNDILKPRRVRAWLPALFGFLAGVAVWHAIGFWAFMITVVQGVPAPDDKLLTLVVRSVDTSGWQRVSSRWQQDDSVRFADCVALSPSANGSEATAAPCDRPLHRVTEIDGVAPRLDRLQVSHPLAATVGAPNPAPVAGWAARVENIQTGIGGWSSVSVAIEAPNDEAR
ncbi:MAG: hypothetical protein ACFCUN_13500 [Hyphomicrobiaceae bacterium]